jgi:hypothetical protein
VVLGGFLQIGADLQTDVAKIVALEDPGSVERLFEGVFLEVGRGERASKI